MSNPYLPDAPTLQGFIDWSRNVMGLTTIVIPSNSPGYEFAYGTALEIVPEGFLSLSPGIYTLTVYNYGGSVLLQYQQDQRGQSYFSDARKSYGINSFVAGVINSASDVSTSEGLTVGVGLSNLQLIDLQALKDPYGRQALAYMQSIGTLWGIN
jgi:hypothetical protein